MKTACAVAAISITAAVTNVANAAKTNEVGPEEKMRILHEFQAKLDEMIAEVGPAAAEESLRQAGILDDEQDDTNDLSLHQDSGVNPNEWPFCKHLHNHKRLPVVRSDIKGNILNLEELDALMDDPEVRKRVRKSDKLPDGALEEATMRVWSDRPVYFAHQGQGIGEMMLLRVSYKYVKQFLLVRCCETYFESMRAKGHTLIENAET